MMLGFEAWLIEKERERSMKGKKAEVARLTRAILASWDAVKSAQGHPIMEWAELAARAVLIAAPAPEAGGDAPSDDLIAFAITEALGKRCADFDAHCYTCQAWAQYDRLLASPSAGAEAMRRAFYTQCGTGTAPTESQSAQAAADDNIVERICRAICKVEGIDPDEDIMEYETEAHVYRPTDPRWTRYADAVAAALPPSGETGEEK